MIAESISHYRIESQLGQGGMGVVYRAYDTRLERPVALKFLSDQLNADPEAKERFLREARVAASLQHPNICTVYEVGEVDDQTFIAMALYEGTTLDHLISERPIDMDRAISVARQMAAGLGAAHSQGVVHRDIKPGNIMLAAGDIVKILDFGLAKQQHATALTVPGTALGTLFYMSPEQAAGNVVDSRSDIWSFGVVLYEMATGVCPFRRDYPAAVIYAILNERPVPPAELNPSTPAYVASIISQCLDQRVEQRPQSFDEVLELLDSREAPSLVSPTVYAPEFRATPDFDLSRIFVAREKETATIVEAIEASRLGPGRTVLVRGEPGIGKTHLVAQAVAAADSPAIVWGRAHPHESDIPYHPFVRGFRDSVTNIRTLLEHAEAVPSELRPKLPYIRQLLDPTVDSSLLLNKDQLWDATLSLVQYLCDEAGSLVLVVDELHWADRASIELFAFLARSVAELPMLLIGLYRDTATVATNNDANQRLVETLRQLNIERKVTTLTIGRLDAAASTTLLTRLLPEGIVSSSVRRLLQEQTEGHPMFTAETVQLLRDQNVLELMDGEWKLAKDAPPQLVSERVQDVVRQRIDRLDRSDRDVLEAASCQGEVFESGALAACTGVDRLALLKRLQSLESDHGLVTRRESGYRFDHAVIRQVLYEGLIPELRQEYHRLIADELLDRHETDDEYATALAKHLALSGRDKESVPYLVRAAARARALHATEDARDRYEKLVSLIRRHAPTLDDYAPAVWEGLGEVMLTAGEITKAATNFERFLEFAERTDDVGSRIRGLVGLAECLRVTGRLQEAEEKSRLALSLAVDLGSTAMEAGALEALSLVHASRGEYDKSVEESTRAYDLHKVRGDTRGQSVCIGSIGFSYWHMGKYQAAMEHLTEALSLQRSIGDRKGLARTLNFLGLAYWKLGEYERALSCTRESVDIKESIQDTRVIPGSLNLIGDLLREIYRPEEALQYHERSLRLSRKQQNKGSMCDNLRDLGLDHVMLGDMASALDYFEEALSTAEAAGIGWHRTRAHLSMASLQLELGEMEKATELAQRGLDLAKQLGAEELLTEALWVEANVAAKLGDLDSARDRFDEAVNRASKLGHQTILWQIYADYADVHETAGDELKATRARAASRTILEDIAARFTDEDLRASFVRGDRVVEILGSSG